MKSNFLKIPSKERESETLASGPLYPFDTPSLGCFIMYKFKPDGDKKPHHFVMFGVWKNIKQRCGNPNLKRYKDYGGRGISICKQWEDDFDAFYTHMMNLPYAKYKDMSIDRIDNDGNYEPGNVRWATRLQQARNKRKNRA